MNGLDLFHQNTIQPLRLIGLTHSFWTINKDTVLYTWVALLIITLLTFMGRFYLARPETIGGYLAESAARICRNTVIQSLDQYQYRYCAFIGSLFIFIAICNMLILLPYLEEPTKDINTTLALAIISFLYVQKEGIRAHGLWGYIKEFFRPFFLLFPLEVLGRLATIISLSFRLFGNIFGGSIITSMWHYATAYSLAIQIFGTLLGVNLIIMLFFGVFEGLIQAFVFSILTLTYLTMAVAQEDHHD